MEFLESSGSAAADEVDQLDLECVRNHGNSDMFSISSDMFSMLS